MADQDLALRMLHARLQDVHALAFEDKDVTLLHVTLHDEFYGRADFHIAASRVCRRDGN